VRSSDPLRTPSPAVAPPRPVRVIEDTFARSEDLEPPSEEHEPAEETGGFLGQATQGAGSFAGYGSVIELSHQRSERKAREIEQSVERAASSSGEVDEAPRERRNDATPRSDAMKSGPEDRESDPEKVQDEDSTSKEREESESERGGGDREAQPSRLPGRSGPAAESSGAADSVNDRGALEAEEIAKEDAEAMQDAASGALERRAEDDESARAAAENPDTHRKGARVRARAAVAAEATSTAREVADSGVRGGAIAAAATKAGGAAGAAAMPEAPAGAVAMPALDVGGAEPEGGDPAASADDMEALLEGAAEDESAVSEEVDPASLPESTLAEAIAENEDPAPQPAPDLDEGGEGSEMMSPLERDTAMSALAEEGGGAEFTGGGGGGGSPLKEEPPVQPPDVSGLAPEAGLAAIASLPPAALKQALGGVTSAVGRTAASEREGLRAAPPTMARPTGLAAGDPVVGPAPVPAEAPAPKAEPVPRGAETKTPSAPPLPAPAPLATARVAAPRVAGTSEGKVSAKDVQRVQASLDDVPTTDPGLDVDPGPAPEVALAGSADPAQADAQRGALAGSVLTTQQAGLIDVGQDMGETQIHPVVPAETLTATVVPGAEAAAPSVVQPGAGVVGPDDQALSILAQQERGGEINAAIAAASAGMAQKRGEYAATVEGEKATNAAEMAAVEEETAAEQEGLRTQARADVTAARQSWSQEQGELVTTANTEADSVVAEGRQDVLEEASTANTAAEAKLAEGEAKADVERKKAESKAAQEKAGAKEESKGIFGWLASKVESFFAELKAVLSDIFKAARALIREAIELAKSAAVALIEVARQAIVTILDGIGKALILIGDTLLAGFPVLREKWRNFITEQVENAKAEVNAAADRLKARAQELLDKLAAGLEKAIGWLEAGLNTLLDGVAAAIDGALKFAESMVQMLGVFATLITDVAADPIGWIKNLGSSVVDGIKNHLWGALKTAIQEWFNAKLEEVLGLGLTVWNLLKEGGFSLEAVGKLAWEGIKSMIPPVLVQILIEKLVAMIVPAAGAIMAIIEGIRAGYGAIKRIIAAIDTFVAFLKQVKLGGAGPAFARALAAAAVAVIDFVANWLLVKLAKGAAKIAGKIKGIAQRIFKKIKKFFKNRKRKKKLPRHKRGRVTKNKKTDEQKKKDRLKKAAEAIKPQVAKYKQTSVRGVVLRAKMAYWKIRYRLSSVKHTKSGEVELRVNPIEVAGILLPLTDAEISLEIRKAFRLYKQHNSSTENIGAIIHSGSGQIGQPIDTGAGGGSRIAEYNNLIKSNPQNLWTNQSIVAGHDHENQPVEFIRQQMFGGVNGGAIKMWDPENQRIENIGSHKDFVDKINAAFGGDSVAAAKTLVEAQRTGRILHPVTGDPLTPRQSGIVAAGVGLNFEESVRSDAAAVTLSSIQQTAAQDEAYKLSEHQADNAHAPKGAAKVDRAVVDKISASEADNTNKLPGVPTSRGTDAQAAQQIEKEVKAIEPMIVARLKLRGDFLGSKDTARQAVAEETVRHLAQMYGGKTPAK